MTLCERAVQILAKHGFNATLSTEYGSLIVVNFPDKKVVLHHFDIYSFLNNYLS